MIYKMSTIHHKRKMVGSISMKWQPYSIHAIAVAGDYAVLTLGHVAMPFLKTGMEMCLSCAVEDKLHEEPMLVYVFRLSGDNLGLNTGPILSFKIPASDSFYVFHYINAQVAKNAESEHEILVVDMCTYDNMDGVLGEHVLGDINNILTPAIRDTMPYNCDKLRRMEIDIDEERLVGVRELPVVDANGLKYRMELVSVSPDRWGRPACWAYGMTMHVNGSTHYSDMGIGKINLCAQSAEAVDTIQVFHRENVYVGEPLFVPDPDGMEEDDGSLLVVSKDGVSGDTTLLVINAKNMELVAKATSPIPTMFEFHGMFYPVKTPLSK